MITTNQFISILKIKEGKTVGCNGNLTITIAASSLQIFKLYYKVENNEGYKVLINVCFAEMLHKFMIVVSQSQTSFRCSIKNAFQIRRTFPVKVLKYILVDALTNSFV